MNTAELRQLKRGDRVAFGSPERTATVRSNRDGIVALGLPGQREPFRVCFASDVPELRRAPVST